MAFALTANRLTLGLALIPLVWAIFKFVGFAAIGAVAFKFLTENPIWALLIAMGVILYFKWK